MTATPHLRLGTRRSPLAMAQAHEARARLCAVHGWDESAVELVPVVASGDKVQDRPLAEIGGKALWTRELDAWLAERRIDAAVHSMKDVETLRPDWLSIAAILPRADVADVLLGAASIRAIPEGARLGTSAPRRAAQMLHLRPDVKVVPIRGNVATRIAKLAAGEADMTLLAAAGLDRLGETGVGHPLDPREWLPAPAQGAIGIECRADDGPTRDWLSAIDHLPSRAQVMAERALLAALGGNCHSPIAVLSRSAGAHLSMTAALFSADGAGKSRWLGDDGGRRPRRSGSPRGRLARARIAGHRGALHGSMTASLVVLRPEPGLGETMSRAREAGLTAIPAPLFEIEGCPWKAPDAAAFDAIIAGSANAFRRGGEQLPRLRALSVHAVGEQTAIAARVAGFAVASIGAGGLQAVVDAIAPPQRLLRLAGERRVALRLPKGIAVTESVVYRARPLALSAQAAAALARGAVVLLHSADASRQFADECLRLGIDRGAIALAALGPRIAEAAGEGWRAVASATEPSDTALLALAADMCHTLRQGG